MDEETIRLVVQAVGQGFDTAFAGIKGGADAFSNFAHVASKDASGALQTFGVNLGALENPLTLVAQGLKQSMDLAANWGDSVDRLAAASGQTAQEASTMATVFGDFGLEVGSLDRTVRTFTKNGLQFNLATIQDLGEQYRAIKDPVERDEFAFKNFGRSALDMNDILNASPAKLAAMADAAQYTGKVVGEDMVQGMEDARIKAKQLQDRVDGLKISLGTLANNTVAEASDSLTNLAKINQLTIVQVALATGKIGYQEASIRADAIAAGDLTGGMHQLTDAQKAAWTAMNASSDASDRQADRTNALADSISGASRALGHMADNTEAMVNKYPVISAGERKLAEDAQKAADAVLAQNQAQLLSAGLAGTLTKNYQAYQDVVGGNAKKVAELRAEIAKYTALQGQEVIVQTKGQFSAEQLGVAQDRLAIAQERLAAGGFKTKLAFDQATLSVRTAQDAVDNISGHMATAETTTADYSKKIGEDQAALDELTLANSRAADAMVKANAQFVYQQAAAGLSGQAALDFALAMGQIDQKTYDATVAIQGANATYKQTGDLGAYESAVRNITDALNGTAPAADKMPEVLQPAAQAFTDAGGHALEAAKQVLALNQAMDAMHDRTVKIEVDYINKTYGSAGVGYEGSTTPPGGASGLDMIVPSRYTNDSYPVRAQAGERVIVIPAGQPGNGGGPLGGMTSGASGGSMQPAGDTIIINDRAATALYLERKRQERIASMERRM
jgi:hypothetical protein